MTSIRLNSMKTLFRYTSYMLCLLLLAVLTACTDEMIGEHSQASDREGTVSATFTLQFPPTTSVATRTMGEYPSADGSNKKLDLHLFVFDRNGLSQKIYIPAEDVNQDFSKTDPFCTFKVNLATTDGNTVIHLIAIDDPDHTFYNALNSIELFGMEDFVMFNSNFPTTTGGQDAYWQRVDLEGPIAIKENTVNEVVENVQSKLQHIPMIRNFAKVSMENKASSNFTLVGFEVVNAHDRGTIVPAFADKDGNTQFAKFDIDKSNYYDAITKQGYTGRNAAGSRRIAGKRSEDFESNAATIDWSTENKYIYERQFAATNHVFVIMAGRYGGANAPITYYKLDIGNSDGRGLFTYYNLLRNIDYHFVINSVEGEGYSTPAAAVVGTTFNNFSASVELRNMLTVSDGTNMLYVNFTTYVVVNQTNDPIEFRYKYVQNIQNNGGRTSNGTIQATDAEVGLVKGDVIREFEVSSTDDADGWRTVKLWLNDPTADLKQQTFTIYDGQGLSRTITLILKTPWEITQISPFPGLWENFTAVPWNWGATEREVGSVKGSTCTLFFELPDNLPESMFPLQFVIESSKQNIVNAPVGNTVVQSAPSLFDVNDIRIQYVKTVSYYDYDITGDNPYASHVVRCRFILTTDLRDDKLGQNDGTSHTTLRVSNPYFNINDATMIRNANASDPTPIGIDFSSQAWIDYVTTNRWGTSLSYNATTTYLYDQLFFQPDDGNNVTNRTATIEINTNEGYITLTSTRNDLWSSRSYPAAMHRTPKLVIVASNDDNNEEVGIVVTTETRSTTGGNVTCKVNEESSNTVTTKGTIIYDFDVPDAVSEFNIHIKPLNNNRTRIYSLNYYPHGADYNPLSEP